MIHKVLNHGSGPTNPFIYLLNGKNRMIPPRLLLGSPELTWNLIQHSEFKQKYTSLVLSFEEKIKNESILAIIRDYEDMSFSGIDTEDIARSWILHEDKGRTELHCIIANTVLGSGHRWAHYYDKVDRKLFESWQEITNFKYRLSSPKDPERSRFNSIPSNNLPRDKRELFQDIDTLICKALENGNIENRDDIISCLDVAGYEVKPSRKYISIRSKDSSEKYLRLKGHKYEEGFSIRKSQADHAKARLDTTRYNQSRNAEIKAVFERELSKRRGYSEGRYHRRRRIGSIADTSTTKGIRINIETSELRDQKNNQFSSREHQKTSRDINIKSSNDPVRNAESQHDLYPQISNDSNISTDHSIPTDIRIELLLDTPRAFGIYSPEQRKHGSGKRESLQNLSDQRTTDNLQIRRNHRLSQEKAKPEDNFNRLINELRKSSEHRTSTIFDFIRNTNLAREADHKLRITHYRIRIATHRILRAIRERCIRFKIKAVPQVAENRTTFNPIRKHKRYKNIQLPKLQSQRKRNFN